MQPDAGIYEAYGAWEKLVNMAEVFGKAKNPVSPWDILATYVKKSGKSEWTRDPSNPDFEVNALTGERRYVGPQFRTTTASRIDLTDPATAAAMARQLFQQMMGRDPGKGEITGFANALHAAENSAPVETVTTTEFDAMGRPIGERSEQSGGISAEGKAYIGEERIKKDKEYGAYQAATTYMGALEAAIFGAPELE